MEINFWKDRDKAVVDPALFSVKADELAQKVSAEGGRDKNKSTQLRKFYDEVARINSQARTGVDQWPLLMPMLHMLVAKAAYALGRGHITQQFSDFIKTSVLKVEEPKDLKVFSDFFEAFMGFYKFHHKEGGRG